ncbi:hypothetical protein SADUNF_Sadunf08G0016200 [Salix dunnii]|uniref:Uncharacterized protein n=1 Tax=Salix dunnii TaxID=1413687 RepID=A0A835JUU0_9ROSI|nr:hypothetical protein SADUNF_Sadunf08G0016200 [Salix dunnii]
MFECQEAAVHRESRKRAEGWITFCGKEGFYEEERSNDRRREVSIIAEKEKLARVLRRALSTYRECWSGCARIGAMVEGLSVLAGSIFVCGCEGGARWGRAEGRRMGRLCVRVGGAGNRMI